MAFISVSSNTPPGSIIAMPVDTTSVPGHIHCDGSLLDPAVYPTLFAKIGTAHGYDSGTGRFRVPDYRGRFLRGHAAGSSNDPDRFGRVAAVAGTFTLTNSSTTNASSTVTVSSTTFLALGMTVSGTNIPANSIVLQKLSATTFQLGNSTTGLAQNATGTGSGITLTFSVSSTSDFVGSVQTNATRKNGLSISDNHRHQIPMVSSGVNPTYEAPFGGSPNYGGSGNGMAAGAGSGAYSLDSTTYTGSIAVTNGDNETRPLNANVKYFIRY